MERKKRKEGRKENNFPKNFTIGGSISESDLTTIWFEGVFQSSSLLLPLSLSRLGVSRLSAANSVRFNLRAARVWMLFLESIRAFRIDVKIRFTLGNNPAQAWRNNYNGARSLVSSHEIGLDTPRRIEMEEL